MKKKQQTNKQKGLKVESGQREQHGCVFSCLFFYVVPFLCVASESQAESCGAEAKYKFWLPGEFAVTVPTTTVLLLLLLASEARGEEGEEEEEEEDMRRKMEGSDPLPRLEKRGESTFFILPSP